MIFRDMTHPVVQLFLAQRRAFLATCLAGSPIRNALDVGCGTGISSRAVDCPVVGMDQDFSLLQRHPGRVCCGDAHALPFASRSVDLVYAWEALHHLDSPQRVVQEMARVSRRFVLLVEPNRAHPALIGLALCDPTHRALFRYSQRYLCRLLQNAACTIRCLGRGGWIFPHRMPTWMARGLAQLPYETVWGISNWVVGEHP